MRRIPISRKVLALVVALTGCGHDATRENPLDPELTPAVALSVGLDDSSGTATLSWSAYEGAGFGRYQVLRQVSDRITTDTLATIDDVATTRFVDTTLVHDTEYVYRVSVENASGLEVPSAEQRVNGVNLPAVRMQSAQFHSATATAAIEWTEYTGPRFESYQLRRSTGAQTDILAVLDDRAQTSFVDSNLAGNTQYSYSVVVRTTLGEELTGEPVGGSIHALVDTWELEGDLDWIRLFKEPGNRISALMMSGAVPGLGSDDVLVHVFESDGSLVERFSPYDSVPPFGPIEGILSHARAIPWATGMTVDSTRRRIFNASSAGPLLIGFEADGQPVEKVFELSFPDLPSAFDGEEAVVEGQIMLRGVDQSGAFDNVTVSDPSGVLFEEDFSTFPEGDMDSNSFDGWDLLGPHRVNSGRIQPRAASGGARRRDEAWQDFRLECDVYNKVGDFGIQIGGDSHSRFFLHIDKDGRSQATLEWIFTPPPGSSSPGRHEVYEADLPIEFPVSHTGLVAGSRLSLEMIGGRLRASITQRVLWHGAAASLDGLWSTITALGDILVITAGNPDGTIGFSVTETGEAVRQTDLESFVGEARTWTDSEGAQRFGLCFPWLNRLQIGTVRVPRLWDTSLNTRIGPSVGKRGRSLHLPISFDVAPDGRIYVLDAGNGITSLDEGGNHIASWDTEPIVDWSSGAFPTSTSHLLRGTTSVAVDDEGFIYVADAVNRRIQKFAP